MTKEQEVAKILQVDEMAEKFLDEKFHDAVAPETAELIGHGTVKDIFMEGVKAGALMAFRLDRRKRKKG